MTVWIFANRDQFVIADRRRSWIEIVGFPHLARPPVNLQSTELLSAVVERMLSGVTRMSPSFLVNLD